MATLSKMQAKLGALHSSSCIQLMHPHTDHCVPAILELMWGAALGGSAFFSIMYLVQLLMKFHKGSPDREYLINHLKGFGRSVMFTSSLCGVFMTMSCFLRAVLGKYYQYTAVFIPTLCAAQTIFLERPIKRNLYAYTFFQMVLEYVVILLRAKGVRPMSPALETLLFMATNSALLYLATTDTSKKPVYWFFIPRADDPKARDNVLKETTTDKVCSHSHSCLKNTLQSSLQYSAIGVGLQLIHGIGKRFGAFMRVPLQTLGTVVFNKDILRLGVFFGVYVGLYKAITCVLRRRHGAEKGSHVMMAAFLAGFAYRLNRDRTWALSAGTMVLQLLLRRARSKGVLPDLPYMAELVFVICCGILFQVRFLDSPNCPRFIATMLATATNGRVESIYGNFKKRTGDFMLQPQH